MTCPAKNGACDSCVRCAVAFREGRLEHTRPKPDSLNHSMLKRTNHIERFAVIIFAVLTLTGCLQDSPNTWKPDRGESNSGMTFDLLVPKMGDAATRLTRMSAEQENEIGCVHVFLFESGGNGTIIGHTEGAVISNNLAGLTQIYVQMEIPYGDFEVVMVANGPAMVSSAISSAKADAVNDGRGEWFCKGELLKHLCVSNPDGVLNTWIEENIIMYGEATISSQEIDEGNVVRVSMTRMMAAVDFYMSDPDSAFYTILLCNPPQSGMAYPNFTDKRTPNMPPEYTRRESYEFSFTNGTHVCIENIYPFESPATDDSSMYSYTDESTYFILNLKWGGVDSYYRIDLTWDGSVPGTVQGAYMPILRNYRYIVDVKKVLGKGYDTIDEAKKHKSVLNNLNYTIHMVDEGAYCNIVYDNEYYLAVSTDKVVFPMEGGTADLKIDTNYPYQWQASVSTIPNIFRLGLGPAASMGSWDNTFVQGSTDVLSVKSLGSANAHTGKITITAGRLTTYVAIEQSDGTAISLNIYDTSDNEVSNVVFTGNDTQMRSYLIKWTPASIPLNIMYGSSSADGAFEFADDSDDLSAITQLTGGAAILNIRPRERTPVSYSRVFGSSYFLILTYQERSLGKTIEFKHNIP